MRRGSNLLLIMMGVYLLLAAAAFIIFGKNSSLKPAEEEPAALAEQVKGDVTAPREESPQPETVSSDTSGQEEMEESAAEPEPEEQAEPEEEPAPEQKYYRFRASHSSDGLRVRKDPSLRAEVLSKLKPGTEGYVLRNEDGWSEIVTEDGETRGYCYNEYLEFTEIPEEEYPEEYRE